VHGTWGAQCHERLDVRPNDPRIYKGTKPNIDSYSAFFDNCKANDTGLTALLSVEGITDVFVCGLVFDICVKATAIHGAEMGFSVSVVEDACRPLDPKSNKDVKAELTAAGVAVTSAGEAARFAREGRGQTKPLREVLSAAHQSRGACKVLANLEGEGGASNMSLKPTSK
jgi:nicotinamidase/pyrazinamidase